MRVRGRIVRLVVACMAIAMLGAACGDDDDDASSATEASSTTAAPSDDVCADREALESSMDPLQDVDVAAEGTNGVEAALEDVTDDLAAVRSSAGAELQPEVQSVQDDIDQLETAAGNIDSDGAAQAASAVSDLADSVATLLASLDEGC